MEVEVAGVEDVEVVGRGRRGRVEEGGLKVVAKTQIDR